MSDEKENPQAVTVSTQQTEAERPAQAGMLQPFDELDFCSMVFLMCRIALFDLGTSPFGRFVRAI